MSFWDSDKNCIQYHLGVVPACENSTGLNPPAAPPTLVFKTKCLQYDTGGLPMILEVYLPLSQPHLLPLYQEPPSAWLQVITEHGPLEAAG